MIEHRGGALFMTDEAWQNSSNPANVEIARKIIAAPLYEINDLQ